jgi:hypothetical protein
MGLFTIVEDAHAICTDGRGGSYQLDVYQRQVPGEHRPRLYVRKGAFYYLRNGGTSNPSLKLDELVLEKKLYETDSIGRLVMKRNDPTST